MPYASVIKIRLGTTCQRLPKAKNKLTEVSKLGLRLSKYIYKNKKGFQNISISNYEAFITCNTKKKLLSFLQSIFMSND